MVYDLIWLALGKIRASLNGFPHDRLIPGLFVQEYSKSLDKGEYRIIFKLKDDVFSGAASIGTFKEVLRNGELEVLEILYTTRQAPGPINSTSARNHPRAGWLDVESYTLTEKELKLLQQPDFIQTPELNAAEHKKVNEKLLEDMKNVTTKIYQEKFLIDICTICLTHYTTLLRLDCFVTENGDLKIGEFQFSYDTNYMLHTLDTSISAEILRLLDLQFHRLVLSTDVRLPNTSSTANAPRSPSPEVDIPDFENLLTAFDSDVPDSQPSSS